MTDDFQLSLTPLVARAEHLSHERSVVSRVPMRRARSHNDR
jgi:hypothetical protein